MRKIRYQFEMTVYNVSQTELDQIHSFQARDYIKKEHGLSSMLSDELRRRLEQQVVDRFAKCAISPVRLRLTIEQDDPRTYNILDKIYNFFRRKK